MEKWEYCCLRIFDPFKDQAIAKVNELGLEGWEMVNLSGMGFLGITIYSAAYFKRKLP